ncbi:COG1361 family protein [Candidatus Methanocrinis natronophilus]|uniref:DUF11 domain-containing protein n=1 Tax=Candidatus Methanocrinis natronophilus TaxID=3033396 RepID=A0ABT5X537_9EURY|nr:hypothetical protein [Candidatus Methanocrinis natronophilus]MDF0589817.1 hypothetical protein [Candidatus Methanocrinis natronophilus]
MMRLIAIVLLVSTIGSGVEWGGRAEGELRWGEALSAGGYSLMVADFTPEEVTARMVMLELSRGGELVATRALGSGESFSLDDEVMVVAQEVWMRDRLVDGLVEPRARVVLLARAVPEIRILVVSEEETFEAGEVVKLKVEVENVGVVEAEDVVVEVTTDPPIFSSIYRKSGLLPGEAWDEDRKTAEIDPIKVRFTAPPMDGPQDVSVKVRARYLDDRGVAHESWGGTSFRIFGLLKLNKYAEEAMKLEDESIVRLSVSNRGERPLVVDLTDSAGRDFETGTPLNWKISIPPGEMESKSYTIRAKKPGVGQVLPPAVATYSIDGVTYRVTSRSPVIDVIGPLVEVDKKAAPTTVRVGEDVTVTLTATNVGNRRTMVTAEVTVPAWGSLASGETDSTRLLLPGETAALIYTISCPVAGRFEIPPTIVCYRDEDGTACTVESRRIRIVVEEEGGEELNITTDALVVVPPSTVGPSPAEEGGAVIAKRSDGDGDVREREDGQEGQAPARRSPLWALAALILTIFIALDRFL